MTEYKHKEAFALMHYACQGCGHHEVIWNSRDGITPFSTSCPSCGQPDLSHVRFDMDRCVPDHKPHRGQRMWVNLTLEEARARAAHAVARRVPEKQDNAEYIEELAQRFYSQWGEGVSPAMAVFGYTENPSTEERAL